MPQCLEQSTYIITTLVSWLTSGTAGLIFQWHKNCHSTRRVLSNPESVIPQVSLGPRDLHFYQAESGNADGINTSEASFWGSVNLHVTSYFHFIDIP